MTSARVANFDPRDAAEPCEARWRRTEQRRRVGTRVRRHEERAGRLAAAVLQVERNIGRVFRCSAELDGAVHKLVFHHLLDKPQAPDFFMFAVTSRCTGLLSIESEHWKSDGVHLFAVSEFEESQEAILLMPGHSWIRGGLGTFIADPDRDRPWRATLRLLG